VSFLSGKVHAGETVQVMDGVSGGIHALYDLRCKQPTRFIYDGHFFHDIDEPYVQNLRAEFMAGLRMNPPAFLVFSVTSWPLAGYERLEAFPELAELLSREFQIVSENKYYRIYRYRGL